jgi:hypothetical protein
MATIDFDDQFDGTRDGITDEGADGHLAIEADASELPVAENRPQHALGRGWVVTERA